MTDIALPRSHRQTLISRQEVLKVVDGQLQSELAPSGTIAACSCWYLLPSELQGRPASRSDHESVIMPINPAPARPPPGTTRRRSA